MHTGTGTTEGWTNSKVFLVPRWVPQCSVTLGLKEPNRPQVLSPIGLSHSGTLRQLRRAEWQPHRVPRSCRDPVGLHGSSQAERIQMGTGGTRSLPHSTGGCRSALRHLGSKRPTDPRRYRLLGPGISGHSGISGRQDFGIMGGAGLMPSPCCRRAARLRVAGHCDTLPCRPTACREFQTHQNGFGNPCPVPKGAGVYP